MRSKYPPLLPGASAEHVSKSVALAKANVHEEMTGFNVRSKTARPFNSAEGFLRWKLGRAANNAFNKMAPHLKGACVFRVTLTVSSAIRLDRAFHAADLKSFMKRALREIRPWAVAYCANLHVHWDNYLHVDATVVVRDEDVERFRRQARMLHTLGWRPSLGVRASTCKIMPQGDQETDLQRSLDYTLRYDRHRRRPEWIKEAIRAIGVARSSGFKQSRASKYPKASAWTTNSLSGRGNSVRNACGIALQQTQGTTKNPNVASLPRVKRGARTPGRPPKRLHSAYRRDFRRDREARERDFDTPASQTHSAKHLPRRAILMGLMSSTASVVRVRPQLVGAMRNQPVADPCNSASTLISHLCGTDPERRNACRVLLPTTPSGKRPGLGRGKAIRGFNSKLTGMGVPFLSPVTAHVVSPALAGTPWNANQTWWRA